MAVGGWGRIFYLRLSVFPHDIYDRKTWHRNVPRWVLEIYLFWSQKVKGKGHKSQKHCRRGSLHSCEYWLLLLVAVSFMFRHNATSPRPRRWYQYRSNMFGSLLSLWTKIAKWHWTLILRQHKGYDRRSHVWSDITKQGVVLTGCNTTGPPCCVTVGL